MTVTTSTSKWWWNKKSFSKSTTKKDKSCASSLNGADEGASMFSLYSYDQSLYCPSIIVQEISSSIKAQHTKSEYSGNFSDVESNASILSKPWISRNIIDNNNNKSMTLLQQQYQMENNSSSSTTSSSHSSIISPNNNKRRASLVDYLVHGKLKAGFGRLVGRSYSANVQNDETTTHNAAVRRRNSFS